jgi:hypothetical protein
VKLEKREYVKMWSTMGVLVRKCTRDYAVPGTEFRLKQNDLVSISVAGIHTDPGRQRFHAA